jgi:hypothetical protein
MANIEQPEPGGKHVDIATVDSATVALHPYAASKFAAPLYINLELRIVPLHLPEEPWVYLFA